MKIRTLLLIISIFALNSAQSQVSKQPNSVTLCSGSSAYFRIKASYSFTANYQWQRKNGSKWTKLNNTGVYSRTTTDSMLISAATDSLNNTAYRCVIDSAGVIKDSSSSAVLSINTVITSHPSSKAVCPGIAVSFSVSTSSSSGLSYQWRKGGTDITGAKSSSYSISSPNSGDAGNYDVVITPTGCSSITSNAATLTIYASPVVNSNPSDTAQCPGLSTSFRITASGTSLTYQWQVNTGAGWSNISTAGSSPTYSNWNTAILKLSGIVSGNNGYKYQCVVSGTCTPSATSGSAVLTLYTTPSVSGNPTNSAICEGNSTTFKCTAAGTNIKYQWQVYDGTSWADITTSGSNPVYSNYNTSVLNLSSTVASNNGYKYRCVTSGLCSPGATSADATLTIFNSPVITSNPTNITICEGASASFKTTATGTTLTYQWQVNSGSGWTDITAAGSVPTYSNWNSATLGLSSVVSWNNGYLYRCIVSGTCTPSQTTSSAQLSVNTTPSIASHPSNATVCEGNNAIFQITANGTNLSFQWQVNSGAGWASIFSPGTNPTYSNASSNTLTLSNIISLNNNFQYRCFVINNGCNGAYSNLATLKVNSKPLINAGSDDSVCTGSTKKLNAIASSGTAPYSFLWSPSIGINNNLINDPIAAPSSTTIFSVTVTDSKGCNASDDIKIAVLPLPRANAGFDAAICKGNSTILNGNGGESYEWLPNIGLDSNNKANPSADPTQTTIYTVYVKDKNGCTDYDMVKITVNELPSVHANEDTAICIGQNMQLNAMGAMFYSWYPETGLNSTQIYNPISAPKKSTQYVLTGWDLNGCKNKDSVTVKVYELPKVTIHNDTGICPGKTVLLNAEGGAKYEWSPMAGLDSNKIQKPLAHPKTTTRYTVHVTDQYGCGDSQSIEIKVFPSAIAIAGEDITICTGSTTSLNANIGNIKYNWSPGLFLDDSNARNPNATPLRPINYRVSVVDSNGCVAVDSIKINILPNPEPIITGDTSVCKNAHWSKYSIPKTNNNIQWNIINGEVTSGQGTNSIIVHWFDTTAKYPYGEVQAQETYKVAPGCSTMKKFKVTIGKTLSPTPPKIIAKSNNVATELLICPNCPFKYYIWGFENKITGKDSNTCKNILWCHFPNIDTSKNRYYAKVGDDLNCLTKAYFNAPEIVKTQNFNLNNSNISIYPNPTNDAITIKSEISILKIQIQNTTGESLIHSELKNTPGSAITVNMNSFPAGIYFVTLHTVQGNIAYKVIKM